MEVVDRLEAVHEWSSLDRHAPSRRLDPRMRFGQPRRHRQIELHDVTTLPRALDLEIPGGAGDTHAPAVEMRARPRAPARHAEIERPRLRAGVLDRQPHAAF